MPANTPHVSSRTTSPSADRAPEVVNGRAAARVQIRVGATPRTLWAVRQLFRVSVHVLTCLASLMLAIAEGTLLPVILTIPLAIAAFCMTGHRRGVHLPNALANVAGFIAVVTCAWEFVDKDLGSLMALVTFQWKALAGGNSEARLLAGAHLLVYLTWIVLFQKKSVGTYWWICALSVLQVAVGSLLLQTSLYGLYLLGYAFVAVWTLSVFSVYRAYLPDGVDADDVDRLVPTAERCDPTSTVPASTAGGGTSSIVVSPFGDVRPASRAVGTVQLDERPGILGLRFVAGVMGTTSAALVVAGLVFLMFPRLWNTPREMLAEDGPSSLLGGAITGYSESVQLGSMGPILQSSERVFEVRMREENGGQVVDVEAYARRMGYDEPLFRGRVFDQYVNGRWFPGRWREPFGQPPGRRTNLVRQEYRGRALRTTALFAMHPVRSVRGGNGNEFRGPDRVLRHKFTTEFHDDAARNVATEYVAFSYPERRPRAIEDSYLDFVERTRQLDRFSRAPGLARIRDFVAADRAALQAGTTTPRNVAEKYESLLRDSGRYGYSLQGGDVPDGVDPVEHFLFETRVGHCEYYAAALVLLLRECGIPARYVVGFKGGTLNDFTGYFEVEQRHAHAWVEAFLTDEPIVLAEYDHRFGESWHVSRLMALNRDPGDHNELGMPRNLRDGAWVVLDATPAAERHQGVEDSAHSVRSFVAFRSFLVNQWDWYVLRMNAHKQQEQFYEPLREFSVEAWNTLRGDDESRRSLWERLLRIGRSPETWFSPIGFFVSFVALTLLLGLVKLLRFAIRSFWPGDSGADDPSLRRARLTIPFYERFSVACRRLGFERRLAQTQREFADFVAESLALRAAGLPNDSTGTPAISLLLPVEVVRDFYEVRFGSTPLPPARLADLEAELTRFEAAVAALHAPP